MRLPCHVVAILSNACLDCGVEAELVSERVDGRRAAGAQTRQRLLDAAADLLASHGEAGLTLRAVSAVAGSNVATVKYHFGSRDGLVDEVITSATQAVVGAQLAALDTLESHEPAPSPEALIRAWATPLVQVAISRDHGDRRLGRIIGQGQASHNSRLDRKFKNATAEPTQRLRDALRRALPHLETADLTLRVALMVSALSGFASGAFEDFITQAEPTRELRTRIINRLIALTTT
jgi:AcrR family transcriptional regulator